MTTRPGSPLNPAPTILTEADWRRLTLKTRQYAAGGYALMGRARLYLKEGDLRQASEKGWGSAAQIVKAAAEHWRDSNVVHQRHQDLRALVAGLATADRHPELYKMFAAAQDLHENFYENNVPQYIVSLNLDQVAGFVAEMTPQLRRPSPPRGFSQEVRASEVAE